MIHSFLHILKVSVIEKLFLKTVMSKVYFPQTNKPMRDKKYRLLPFYINLSLQTDPVFIFYSHTHPKHDQFFLLPHTLCRALLKTSPVLKYLCHRRAGSQWISLHTNLATFQRDRREVELPWTCVGADTTVRQLERLKVTSGRSKRTAILLLK